MQTVKFVPVEVAILVQGGVVQEVRSNCEMLKVHIVDCDNEPSAGDAWDGLSEELVIQNL